MERFPPRSWENPKHHKPYQDEMDAYERERELELHLESRAEDEDDCEDDMGSGK